MKQVVQDITWKGKFQNESFKDLKLVNLSVFRGRFNNCTYQDCEFYNCYLGYSSWGIKTKYSNCSFKKCRIYGKYSSMGSASKRRAIYNQCLFENVSVEGTAMLNGLEFIDCHFTGKMKNCILNKLKFDHNMLHGVKFTNCDLLNVKFENVSVYDWEVFENCSMPKHNMVYLNNSDNVLLNKAEEILAKQENKEITISNSVLFRKDQFWNQSVLMLDQILLKGMLKTPEEQNIFDTISEGRIFKEPPTTTNN